MMKTINRNLLVFAATALFCVSTVSAQDAEPAETPEKSVVEELGFQQVFGEGMLKAYENKTMEGVYKEFAADVAAGRRPVTFTETHHDNATTTYEHRTQDETYTIKGIYTVQKDTICYHYNSPGRVVGSFCFYVFLQESCYFHFYANEGIPTTLEEFDNWSSMAYAKEDAGTCLPNIS